MDLRLSDASEPVDHAIQENHELRFEYYRELDLLYVQVTPGRASSFIDIDAETFAALDGRGNLKYIAIDRASSRLGHDLAGSKPEITWKTHSSDATSDAE